MYLLVRNETDNKNEAARFCSLIKGAKNRIECLDAVQKLNLFNSVTFKTKSAREFSGIIIQNYARREGNTLHYEFVRDASLNCSYTIINL